ncbi:MAG: FHA domain-containing protein [Pirellulales bacterium]
MKTVVLENESPAVPALEVTDAAGKSERYPIEAVPLSIGRDPTSDIQLDFSRVSREHAVIVLEGGSYRVRDLGSTNGTFVNGSRIDEAAIGDGDLITVADVELVFSHPSPRRAADNATQVLDRETVSSSAPKQSTILELRRLQEIRQHELYQVAYQPVVFLNNRSTFAYMAVPPWQGSLRRRTGFPSLLGQVECPLAEQLRNRFRAAATEQAAKIPGDVRLILPIDATEIGTETLTTSLDSIRRLVDARCHLAVMIPERTAGDSPYIRDLRLRLNEMNIDVAYGGFTGGLAQVLEHKACAPDFLVLDPTLVRNLGRRPDDCNKIRAVIDACRELNTRVIAEGLKSASEIEACVEVGCELGVGDGLGAARPVSAYRRNNV